MILFTAKFLRVMIPLLTLAGGYFLFHRRLTRKGLVGMGILVSLFAVAANSLSSYVPPMKDEVTLTALGVNGENAQNCEIVVKGFLIDGETFPIGKVAGGKWFWRGDQYMWRSETDVRQPAGTTRTITLEIPVGWSRTVLFDASPYRGYVEVRTEEWEAVIDTSVTSSIEINRNRPAILILNQVRILAVYAVVFTLLSGMLYLCADRALKDPGRARSFWEKNWFYAALTGICFVSLALMVRLCGQDSLEQDEMAMISYITQTDSIGKAMLTDIAWPPLWKGIMFIWYRLVPYGDKWLLLLPELVFLPGIFYTGLIGDRFFNRRVGLIAAILIASNARLVIREAANITCYSPLYTLSAIVLYQYFKRISGESTRRSNIVMLVCMVLASYTHYFGFFLSGTLFLIEAARCIAEKKRVKEIVKSTAIYFLTGILYAPWLLYIILVENAAEFNYWQPKPTLSSIPVYLKMLSGDITVPYVVLLFGLLFTSITILTAIKSKKDLVADKIVVQQILVPLVLFICVFLYGKCIAIGNTFWIWRYFTVVVPCFTCMSALGINGVYELLAERKTQGAAAKSMLAFAMIGIVFLGYNAVKQWGETSSEPFREGSEWIRMNWEQMYESSTMIISANPELGTKAMISYYITQKEQKAPCEDVNIYDIFEVTKEQIDRCNRVAMVQSLAELSGARDKFRVVQGWLSEDFTVTQAHADIEVYVYERTNPST